MVESGILVICHTVVCLSRLWTFPCRKAKIIAGLLFMTTTKKVGKTCKETIKRNFSGPWNQSMYGGTNQTFVLLPKITPKSLQFLKLLTLVLKQSLPETKWQKLICISQKATRWVIITIRPFHKAGTQLVNETSVFYTPRSQFGLRWTVTIILICN